MAKKLEPAVAAGSDGVSSDDLKTIVKNINQPKEKAAEYVGLSGKATAEAVDKFSLNRQALTMAARLQRMDASKRQEVLRALLDYTSKLGHYDQTDAFDDLIPTLEGIVRKARGSSPRATGGGVVASLVN